MNALLSTLATTLLLCFTGTTTAAPTPVAQVKVEKKTQKKVRPEPEQGAKPAAAGSAAHPPIPLRPRIIKAKVLP